MNLPQELRDKIYEGLLCPHVNGTQYRSSPKIWRYGLEPAILCTCKRVCEEASKVLYTKNGTALIRVDAEAYETFQMARSEGWPRFTEIFPIAKVECGKVGGLPMLEMDISVLPHNEAKDRAVSEDQLVFIGFLPVLPRICKFITCGPFTAKLQLVVNMERPIGQPLDNRQQILSDCLEFFCEARGLGRAAILIEPQHSATAAKVVDLMMTPMKSAEEVFSLTCAYEARVLRQMKEKRWNDARDTLENGLDLFGWIYYLVRTSKLAWLNEKKRHELQTQMINMQWEYVSCCLKLGRTGELYDEIREMFQYWSPEKRTVAEQQGYWDRVADAHCAIAKAYVIDGALNSALYSFLQALLTAPGHIEADRAIDSLEERVKSSSKPEDVMVRLNIECVMREVRHREPVFGRLTKDEAKNLVGGFIATYKEIQSISQDPFVRGATKAS